MDLRTKIVESVKKSVSKGESAYRFGENRNNFRYKAGSVSTNCY
jgi:hypothetical protein